MKSACTALQCCWWWRPASIWQLAGGRCTSCQQITFGGTWMGCKSTSRARAAWNNKCVLLYTHTLSTQKLHTQEHVQTYNSVPSANMHMMQQRRMYTHRHLAAKQAADAARHAECNQSKLSCAAPANTSAGMNSTGTFTTEPCRRETQMRCCI